VVTSKSEMGQRNRQLEFVGGPPPAGYGNVFMAQMSQLPFKHGRVQQVFARLLHTHHLDWNHACGPVGNKSGDVAQGK